MDQQVHFAINEIVNEFVIVSEYENVHADIFDSYTMFHL